MRTHRRHAGGRQLLPLLLQLLLLRYYATSAGRNATKQHQHLLT
jgi:hypothetical protein